MPVSENRCACGNSDEVYVRWMCTWFSLAPQEETLTPEQFQRLMVFLHSTDKDERKYPTA